MREAHVNGHRVLTDMTDTQLREHFSPENIRRRLASPGYIPTDTEIEINKEHSK